MERTTTMAEGKGKGRDGMGWDGMEWNGTERGEVKLNIT